MELRAWREGMTDEESKHLAYWERNMLALRFADGWYNDDVEIDEHTAVVDPDKPKARLDGWRRVLSLDNGQMCFHIPDDFDVGCLREIEQNWDGHSTIEKWARVADRKGIQYTLPADE